MAGIISSRLEEVADPPTGGFLWPLHALDDGVASAAESFAADGFVCAPGGMTPERAAALRAASLADLEACHAAIGEPSLQVGLKHGYKELVQRSPLRYDITLSADRVGFDPEKDLSPRVLSLVRAVLGDDCLLLAQSVVHSMPGSTHQHWHEDGGHRSKTEHLPCHVLNVFVPLQELRAEIGPTEVRPGSHFITRQLARMMLMAKLRKTLRSPVAPTMPAGSVLMFDYRLLHRGRANVGDHTRSMLCLAFAKPWFRDILNWPRRSLFEPEKREATAGNTQVRFSDD